MSPPGTYSMTRYEALVVLEGEVQRGHLRAEERVGRARRRHGGWNERARAGSRTTHGLSSCASVITSSSARTWLTCPFTTISAFRSFFIAYTSPLALSRQSRTSPNAPRPMMSSCSKSAAVSLARWARRCSLSTR